jgi:hypothetical protein
MLHHSSHSPHHHRPRRHIHIHGGGPSAYMVSSPVACHPSPTLTPSAALLSAPSSTICSSVHNPRPALCPDTWKIRGEDATYCPAIGARSLSQRNLLQVSLVGPTSEAVALTAFLFSQGYYASCSDNLFPWPDQSPPSPNFNTASLFVRIIHAPETEQEQHFVQVIRAPKTEAIQTDRTLESPPAHFSAPPLMNSTS